MTSRQFLSEATMFPNLPTWLYRHRNPLRFATMNCAVPIQWTINVNKLWSRQMKPKRQQLHQGGGSCKRVKKRICHEPDMVRLHGQWCAAIVSPLSISSCLLPSAFVCQGVCDPIFQILFSMLSVAAFVFKIWNMYWNASPFLHVISQRPGLTQRM